MGVNRGIQFPPEYKFLRLTLAVLRSTDKKLLSVSESAVFQRKEVFSSQQILESILIGSGDKNERIKLLFAPLLRCSLPHITFTNGREGGGKSCTVTSIKPFHQRKSVFGMTKLLQSKKYLISVVSLNSLARVANATMRATIRLDLLGFFKQSRVTLSEPQHVQSG